MTVVRHTSRVVRNTPIAPGTIELEIERAGFTFRAGEELILHGNEPDEDRAYSLAGGEQEPLLKLLIRVIPEGRVSPRLARLSPNDTVSFSGPNGSFLLRDPARAAVAVASGTGIAPFRSMLFSHPAWRPILLHGVRHAQELYYRAELEPRCAAYVPCISRDAARPRRVTDALTEITIDPDTDIYLCGGQPMIRAAHTLLIGRGHAPERIFTETYYFW